MRFLSSAFLALNGIQFKFNKLGGGVFRRSGKLTEGKRQNALKCADLKGAN